MSAAASGGGMKRASYREGVRWIAHNDDPDVLDLDTVAGLISTVMLADLFGVEPARVARDVLRERKRAQRQEPPRATCPRVVTRYDRTRRAPNWSFQPCGRPVWSNTSRYCARCERVLARSSCIEGRAS